MYMDIFDTHRTIPPVSKYALIYADPPWKQSKGGRKAVRSNSSGTPLDYPVLSLTDIQSHLAQAVGLCNLDSVLFLWTIDKYLFEAQALAEGLGFKLHARMIWDKVTGIPAAFTVRYGHEYLLYMYRGKLVPVAHAERGKIHTVFREKVRRHSQKPDIAYGIIERLYPDARKIELYARSSRPGWDCWGDQAPLEAVREDAIVTEGGVEVLEGSIGLPLPVDD
jgi:N6-adenosine-specific RNA methylase IME4